MREVTSKLLNEKYYEIDHASGLKILVMPKPTYSTTYATFGTKYGSIDNYFKLEGETEITEVPEGIAHFLEHKLFESEELDAFERFAKTGASANAFTSFDRTCYLFSCTENFEQNLEILLDFVQNPYFTEETVQKEQGIIGQEIKMYQDAPGWQVMFNLLRAMYHTHPVRIDLAGTVESIADITADLLYKCYNTFYNLHNMVLCVAGNVDVRAVEAIADRCLKPAEKQTVIRSFPEEPAEVKETVVTQQLAVSQPLFCIGYKETYTEPERTLKEKIETSILMEIIAGGMSPLYQSLLEQGLVSPGFGCEYFNGYGYATMLFQGESKDPEAVKAAIDAEILRLKEEGISKEIFDCVLKELYGASIMAYNDIENIAQGLVESHFSGVGMFEEMDIFKAVTIEDVQNRLNQQLDVERSVLSTIQPL